MFNAIAVIINFNPSLTGSEYKVLDCYHDVQFEDWHSEHIIADSFEDWLVKMFDEVIEKNYRPEYWIPSPLSS